MPKYKINYNNLKGGDFIDTILKNVGDYNCNIIELVKTKEIDSKYLKKIFDNNIDNNKIKKILGNNQKIEIIDLKKTFNKINKSKNCIKSSFFYYFLLNDPVVISCSYFPMIETIKIVNETGNFFKDQLIEDLIDNIPKGKYDNFKKELNKIKNRDWNDEKTLYNLNDLSTILKAIENIQYFKTGMSFLNIKIKKLTINEEDIKKLEKEYFNLKLQKINNFFIEIFQKNEFCINLFSVIPININLNKIINESVLLYWNKSTVLGIIDKYWTKIYSDYKFDFVDPIQKILNKFTNEGIIIENLLKVDKDNNIIFEKNVSNYFNIKIKFNLFNILENYKDCILKNEDCNNEKFKIRYDENLFNINEKLLENFNISYFTQIFEIIREIINNYKKFEKILFSNLDIEFKLLFINSNKEFIELKDCNLNFQKFEYLKNKTTKIVEKKYLPRNDFQKNIIKIVNNKDEENIKYQIKKNPSVACYLKNKDIDKKNNNYIIRTGYYQIYLKYKKLIKILIKLLEKEEFVQSYINNGKYENYKKFNEWFNNIFNKENNELYGLNLLKKKISELKLKDVDHKNGKYGEGLKFLLNKNNPLEMEDSVSLEFEKLLKKNGDENFVNTKINVIKYILKLIILKGRKIKEKISPLTNDDKYYNLLKIEINKEDDLEDKILKNVSLFLVNEINEYKNNKKILKIEDKMNYLKNNKIINKIIKFETIINSFKKFFKDNIKNYFGIEIKFIQN